MDALSLDHLLLFTAAWWVFATIIGFLAAFLLWSRGASQLTGQLPGLNGMAVRFTGAGAIWGFTLLLFYLVRPGVLASHTDVMLIYARGEQPQLAAGVTSIEAKGFDGIDLSDKDLNFELIHRDWIFPLLLDGNNRLIYQKTIPTGLYELRITNARTLKKLSLGVEVPMRSSLAALSGPAGGSQ